MGIGRWLRHVDRTVFCCTVTRSGHATPDVNAKENILLDSSGYKKHVSTLVSAHSTIVAGTRPSPRFHVHPLTRHKCWAAGNPPRRRNQQLATLGQSRGLDRHSIDLGDGHDGRICCLCDSTHHQELCQELRHRIRSAAWTHHRLVRWQIWPQPQY